jgi:hypothetical protein
MIATEEPMRRTAEKTSFNPVLRGAAKVISYVFHPLFIPVYIGWFFVYGIDLFAGQDPWHKTLLILQFFVNYTLLPLVTILLARALGFVHSVYLKTQKDRIIPYVACEIFYFWAWYVFKNQGYPKEAILFALAVFLASCMGMLLNTYMKVSMHAISLGVVSSLMVYMGLGSDENYGFYISIALLVAGLTGTARMINKDHNPIEVYAGFFTGAIALLLGSLFV